MTTKLGVQLYSLREELSTDFDRIIPLLSAMHYAGVEPWGGLPVAFDHAAKLFAQNGLECPSAHLPLLAGDDRQKWLDAAYSLGVKTIVLPWLPESDFANAESLKRTAEKINESALAARSAGFAYGYHNHWFEWTIIEGRPAIDRLAEMIDPSVVFEFDLYWAKVAGHEPADVLRKYGSRVPLVHLKDGPADGKESSMVAAGDGVIDFKAIFAACTAEWGFVELDRCATDMTEAVRRSAGYLLGRGWVQGK